MEQVSAIALGSTSPEAPAIFQQAVAGLVAGGWREAKLSRIFRTEPVDCVPGTPEFANAVVTGHWPGTPRELLAVTQALEVAAGRPREHGYHEARSLDLDILLVGEWRVEEPELQVPHPRAAERNFVLDPLRDIAPELEMKLRVKS